ncbi:MAG TPA: NUDIX domain-containing protein [Lacisediminihabitans sp.]|uniref:NUDIX domain-containing protein n=1 Tax=Lacisediminihabitans sp. TaxID=2787631 RepID=UPI002ED9E796
MRSCGILLYRYEADSGLAVWIGHMGGPFWAGKDAAAWSVPKGEPLPDETELDAALREFAEEIGAPAPRAEYRRLGDFRQPSGKIVTVFAGEAEFGVERVSSNTFDLEWPPRSGRIGRFPEIDDAGWFPIEVARQKVVKGQVRMLDALRERLEAGGAGP